MNKYVVYANAEYGLLQSRQKAKVQYANETIEMLEKELQNYPDDEKMLVFLALGYIHQAKYVDAIKIFEKCIKVNPSSMHYDSLGRLFHLTRQYNQAANSFKKACELAADERAKVILDILYEFSLAMHLWQKTDIFTSGQWAGAYEHFYKFARLIKNNNVEDFFILLSLEDILEIDERISLYLTHSESIYEMRKKVETILNDLINLMVSYGIDFKNVDSNYIVELNDVINYPHSTSKCNAS